MTSNPTSSFSPQQLLWYKKFFNNISSFLDLNDLVINEFNTFCMNSLNDIPYHSHKSLNCSYSRSFIVYKDNTVTTHSISIPVFYCGNCNHYHALLLSLLDYLFAKVGGVSAAACMCHSEYSAI